MEKMDFDREKEGKNVWNYVYSLCPISTWTILYNTVTASKHRCLRFRNIRLCWCVILIRCSRKDRVRVEYVFFFFYELFKCVRNILYFVYAFVFGNVCEIRLSRLPHPVYSARTTRARILNYSHALLGGFNVYIPSRLHSVDLKSCHKSKTIHTMFCFFFSPVVVTFNFRNTLSNADHDSR